MYLFLIPLLAGFACDAASAFTGAYSRRWGERRGRLITIVLRNVIGIPVWVVGLGFAVRAPSPAVFASSAPLAVAGWLLLVLGGVVQLLALAALRARAAAPSVRDALVEQGPYRRLRHPIYLGLILQFLGIVLVQPHLTVVVACAVGIGWVPLQARCEELDLVQRLPAYREYMGRVPRFVPRLGTRTRAPGGGRG